MPAGANETSSTVAGTPVSLEPEPDDVLQLLASPTCIQCETGLPVTPGKSIEGQQEDRPAPAKERHSGGEPANQLGIVADTRQSTPPLVAVKHPADT